MSSEQDAGTSELVDHIVSLTIVRAVTRTERLFAVVRAVFCLAIATLFLASADRSTPTFPLRAALELGASLGGLAASAVLFQLFRRRSASEPLRVTSVAIDSLLCIIALSGNALAPTPDHPGLSQVVDPAVIPLIIMASVLRVSRAAVLASVAICVSGLAILLIVQSARGLDPDPLKLTLLSVYVSGATGLALFTTNRAREVFSRVGRAVIRAEGARGGVFALLQDHHDLRSSLGSLQLRADRLGEVLERSARETPEVEDLRLQMQRCIDILTNATQKTRDRALGALSGLAAPVPANIEQALTIARSHIGQADLQIEQELGPKLVLFGGGTDGLSRLLGHFLLNAMEGDGRSGARIVKVRTASTSPALVDLVLEDDGPGFSPEMLELGGRSRSTSTKPGSAGIGLWLSRSTIVAAGGTLRLGNTLTGARISIRLPSSGTVPSSATTPDETPR